MKFLDQMEWQVFVVDCEGCRASGGEVSCWGGRRRYSGLAGEVWADGEGCGGRYGLEMAVEEDLGLKRDFWVDSGWFLALEGAQGRVGFWIVSVCVSGCLWVFFL